MNKKWMILIGICTASLLFAACASKSGEPSSAQSQSETGAAPVRWTEVQTQSQPQVEMPEPENRILMYNGTLYYGTPETGPMGDSGAVAGRISASVGPDEIPAEDGQSNFGCIDNPYTADYGDGFIMVFVDEEWYCFYSEKAGANGAVQ